MTQIGYSASSVSSFANPALFETHAPKICLERLDLAGRDNGPNISIRSHECPITGGQTISVAQVTILIKDIAPRADCMDVQPLAWRYGIAFNVIAQ
jgi:hypothetical protein